YIYDSPSFAGTSRVDRTLDDESGNEILFFYTAEGVTDRRLTAGAMDDRNTSDELTDVLGFAWAFGANDSPPLVPALYWFVPDPSDASRFIPEGSMLTSYLGTAGSGITLRSQSEPRLRGGQGSQWSLINHLGFSPPPIQLHLDHNSEIDYTGELALPFTISHRLNLSDDTWETFGEQLTELVQTEQPNILATSQARYNLFPTNLNSLTAAAGGSGQPVQYNTVGFNDPGALPPALLTYFDPDPNNLGVNAVLPPFDGDTIQSTPFIENLHSVSVDKQGNVGAPEAQSAFNDYAQRMARIGRLDFTRSMVDFRGFDPNALNNGQDDNYIDMGQDSSLNVPVATLLFDVFDPLAYNYDAFPNGNMLRVPNIPTMHGRLNINTASATALRALPGLNAFNESFPGHLGPNTFGTDVQDQFANPAEGIIAYRQMVADPFYLHTAGSGYEHAVAGSNSISFGIVNSGNEKLARRSYDYRNRASTTGIPLLRGRMTTRAAAGYAPGFNTAPISGDPRYTEDLFVYDMDYPNRSVPDDYDFFSNRSGDLNQGVGSSRYENGRVSSLSGFATIGELLAVRNGIRPAFGLDVLASDEDNNGNLSEANDGTNRVSSAGPNGLTDRSVATEFAVDAMHVDRTIDSAVDDYEEQIMLFERMANLVDVRSDTFLAEVELRGLRFDPNSGPDYRDNATGEVTEDVNPRDGWPDGDGEPDGQWVTVARVEFAAIFDRSNVWTSDDQPRMVFYAEQDAPLAEGGSTSAQRP
ncbi:MAG: hypothetical protein AAGB34_08620, partial [Planctomycetota bacterium]